jgi:hypothetical protein
VKTRTGLIPHGAEPLIARLRMQHTAEKDESRLVDKA